MRLGKLSETQGDEQAVRLTLPFTSEASASSGRRSGNLGGPDSRSTHQGGATYKNPAVEEATQRRIRTLPEVGEPIHCSAALRQS